ncbi:MAG: maleate cis-trans isomerase [Chloroflexi bacterium]|nr:maleate cis-trans isomerase [Chloroflexota bacterium]
MRRLGLLVPSSNTTMEYEFYRYLPPGVHLHTSRMPCIDVNAEQLGHMARVSVDGAALLADCQAEVILFGCTSGSFLEGLGFDRRLEKSITERTGRPVITTTHALLDVFEHLSVKSLLVCTPYIDDINERERRFLLDNGYHVAGLHGLGILENTRIGALDPAEAFKLAFQNDTSEAEAIFISCTNFRTFEIINPLSKVLGKPVITSNQASLWAALRYFEEDRELDIFEPLKKGAE